MVHLILIFLWIAAPISGWYKPNASPSLASIPFLTVWNAPTEPCKSKYGVDLDLGIFDIAVNENQTFMGGNITIFYESKLGLYPYYNDQGVAINGGVPQNASLQLHLQAAWANILTDIPQPDFSGLAVVDWESWRPLWSRNWDSKSIYWAGSRLLVRARHPDWSPEQVEVEAQREFEEAARAFMDGTLKLGRSLRPGGLWGFYGFPGCYNNQYKNATANYTGVCPQQEVQRNDQLNWLWNISSALYPDIYLELSLQGRGEVILRYTRYRVLEALRVASQVSAAAPPVLPYARIAYTYSLNFLSEEDLVHTIGESAALGAAGVVLWGDSYFAKSQATCIAIKSNLEGTLGRYLVNVTSAAALCSEAVCSARGRCRRRDTFSGAYLHLDPGSWTMVRTVGPHGARWHTLRTRQGNGYVRDMLADFDCLCFPGWGGPRCTEKRS
ncbi:hyaluronidase-1 isoform X1 [Brienomyrus brachyistius]|uniref:hyaluronidase-1 isoform X1 n=1 Tax=Brienomyrus brachyistius TaxID=42636 RepID=UPI0020B3F828|nr:hyaluronidase-1 isoform X1 [Brienomyrus brachyistius]XP_048878869.1 hyaluronidase-1 isoform X1 [Brienomyrus brachyistius]XP_048878870.1 hyaluronidase-1 isoform X1 [Brienomyrus brachyistius]XP_048878871.1 hyaluronidase-1 isoform X1 [Brienomyrus brachyistius]